MACTKQMPRNPNVERPTAAMGSDIQPERTIPTKTTTTNLPIKGGKQPQKLFYIKYYEETNPQLEDLRNLIDIDLD